jgi:hypothetical protein
MMMMVIVMMMAIPPIIDANVTASRAYSEKARLDSELLKTSIRVSSAQAFPISQSIDLTLENDGNTKLWNFEKFTLLATYDRDAGGNPERVTEILSYAGVTGSPAAGQWGITGFVQDGIDPQILNPDESITVVCALSDAMYVTGSFAVVVATDNGVSAAGTGGIA